MEKVPRCPVCYAKLEEHKDVTGGFDQPKSGDISVCIKCGTISEFNKDMSLRRLTVTDLIRLWENDEDVYRMVIAARERIRSNKTT